MAEICREPLQVKVAGEDCEAFGADHSIADIARWIMRNRETAEELRDMLTGMLKEDL